jgi:glyoxylase-like metal-dependent hydrolase (beta-lactamase superfamily II)
MSPSRLEPLSHTGIFQLMTSALIDFSGGVASHGELPDRWSLGGEQMQIHRYNEHTYILRQSKAVSFEAPFMFLLFGNDRALLLDTGANAKFPLRATVDELVDQWLAAHPRPAYPLVVAHSHGHGDHVAGDSQFAERPETTVVAHPVAAVREFFRFADWPTEPVEFDLGGRPLTILGIPGHHEASIAIYDPWTRLLLTGDTVYPGRLYIRDIAAFVGSLNRMVTFAQRHPVSHVLGCHIEMTTTPGVDYPIGARHQPNEPPLQLTPRHLTLIRNAAAAAADIPGVHVHDDFILFNGPCHAAAIKHAFRLLASKLRLTG